MTEHNWGYGAQNGPDTWAMHFAPARGDCQSPINIVTANVLYDTELVDHPLQVRYESETHVCVHNTGYSVKVVCNAESTITGGPLGSDVYKLAQFHLHWGSEDSRGAEHTINGKVYSAELHLVHWNSTKYKSINEAVDKKDGLAVFCMFIKVGKSHPGFEVISKHLDGVECMDEECHLEEFNPMVLLPENTKRFWTYAGSLTTPPCYESVQFILYEEVLEFSPEQMNALRSLKFGKDKQGKCMVDNYRPVCYIGTRKVRASFPQK